MQECGKGRTDRKYGLIATNGNYKTKVCFTGINEQREQSNVNSKHGDKLGLILSSATNRPGNPQDEEMWIGDSGATIHITINDTRMFNIKRCDFDITLGNQEITKCTKMGDINLKLKNSAGTTVTVNVPTFIGNLFSIPTAMSNGAEIRFVNNKMEVKKKNDMFEFLPSNTDSYGSLEKKMY